MNIDWAVAIGVFLIFAVGAFAFYSQLFAGERETVAEAMEIISEKVMDNLTVRVHSIPVNVNVSNESVSNKVLYFEYRWPFGKNSTKIVLAGVNQSCNITGNTIYWRSSLNAFVNYFRMRYSEQDTGPYCTGGFSVVNETQVIPFAAEEGERVSLARISGMNATNYSVFKAALGIGRDFNITIQNVTAGESVTLLSYGLQPPKATDVFAKTILGRLEETGTNITVRFLTW